MISNTISSALSAASSVLGLRADVATALLVGLSLGLALLIQRRVRGSRSPLKLLPEAVDAVAAFEKGREAGLVDLVQRYGKNFRMHLAGSAKSVVGQSVVFATADPAVVRTVLMDRAHSVVRPSRYQLARWLPFMDGVLFMHGDVWRTHTAAILPVFAPSNFERFVAAMHLATTERIAAAIKTAGIDSNGLGIDMLPLAKDIGLDNLVTAGFGVDVSTAGGAALQVAMHNYLAVDSARDDTSHELVRFFRTMYNLHKQGVKVEAALKRVLAAGAEFRIGLANDGTRFKPTTGQIAASQAKAAPKAPQKGDARPSADDDAMTVTDLCGADGSQGAADSTEGTIHVNFLDRMISAGMSLREVAGETNHLNGAHKAFAVELTFSLYELARKPAVVERMRAEMTTALAAHGNARAYPVRDDMPALQYSQAVFREVLRMHCISMGILRVTAEPVTVPASPATPGGAPATPSIVLPPNTPVLMLMHAVHHLPEFWEAPLEFRPERWLKPNGKLRSGPRTKFSYFPFLEGPRQCQGRFLVVLEWLVVVNAIIQQYDVALPLAYKLRKKADFYPIPEDPIRIRFVPREREATAVA